MYVCKYEFSDCKQNKNKFVFQFQFKSLFYALFMCATYIYMGLLSNVLFQLVLILWMITLSSCLISQINSFILPPSEYNCVYASTMLVNIATDRLTQVANFGKKKIIFSNETHFELGGYVNKHLGHRKPSLFGADFSSET